MSGVGGSGRRRRWLQAWVAALLVAPGVFLLAARSGAAPELGNYNGTVNATAVHLQLGSSAFPNFATGAVDNHYPLASARLDSSPNAEAFSSPLDTGPLGQTVAAAGSQNQPQYADVRCPAQCDDKPVTVGSQPGPFASSRATDHKAVAFGQAGGAAAGGAPAPPSKSDDAAGDPISSGGALAQPAPASAQPAAPAPAAPGSAAPAPAAPFPALDAGRAAALRSALLAWRSQFLTADDARRYPMPAAGEPDGVSGDTARSEARLDGSTLVLDGVSAVGRVVLGGGAVVLNDVSVHVTVTNDGTPKKTVAVNVGAASVGGTPVTIGADGVSVNGQAVPGIGGAGPQASAALNQALGKAGFEIRSLAPVEKATDHQLTLDAAGVMVRFAPASPAPGVPAGFTALALGEVFADSLAVPGEASGSLDDGLGGLDTGGSVDGGAVGTPAGDGSAVPSDQPAAASAGAAFPSDAGSTAGGFSSGSSGASGSAFGSGSTAGSGPASGSGAAAGSGGSPASAGRTGQLASPAAARRLLGHDKPVSLLLLYLLWQSLVIGTVASLYLWRKAAA